ncbi:hypothetical protein [Helicobacter felis]|uniref:hypothetical protein n=1 Tax=Helicobacter felis TaxID=214 RepID=UPI000CF080D6|nr:hypothetical protein [Helicobacter felis]
MGLSDMCPILGGWQGLETGEKMPRNALIVGLRGFLPTGCCGGLADLCAVFGLVWQWGFASCHVRACVMVATAFVSALF